MIYCFDTSAINRLLDDEHGEAIAASLAHAASVRISSLNLIEVIKTRQFGRRTQLLQLMTRLAADKRPLDLPNSILTTMARAHAAGSDRISVNTDPSLEGLWVAMTNAELTGDADVRELTSWANDREREFDAVASADRDTIQNGLGCPEHKRRASETLRACFGAMHACRRLIGKIYIRQTGRVLDDRDYDSLMIEPAWGLYLSSFAYRFHRRSVMREGHSAKKSENAGHIDLSQSVYLTLCDRFITDDRNQYRALRLINTLNTKRRTEVLLYRTFRRRLLGMHGIGDDRNIAPRS